MLGSKKHIRHGGNENRHRWHLQVTPDKQEKYCYREQQRKVHKLEEKKKSEELVFTILLFSKQLNSSHMLNRQVKTLVWPDLQTVDSGDFVSASGVTQNKV